ncbi:MAG: SPOR domain-containing protein [Deltaproteobacteria bacterium]|nr:SPOR domain-containing protein [Deltaproteobacteria bacterium]
MQDEDRLKEGVELALDNRQIFLLFAASAVVISLVFAFGVVIGKRLSPVVAAGPKTDPLAMLDEAGHAEADVPLSFAQTLVGRVEAKTPPSSVAKAPGSEDPQAVSGAAREAAKKKATESPLPIKKTGQDPKVSPVAPVPPSLRVAPQASKAENRLASKVSKKVKRARGARGKMKMAKAAKAAKGAKARGASAKGEEPGVVYTLQLSSFQDRYEAERFMAKLQAKGHTPTMLPTRIPKRGMWYRVRLGSYASWKEALVAKNGFETSMKLIAYVARR